MKNIYLKFSLFALIAAVFVACEPKINEFEPSKGNADFSSYVAIGNSLTAGYSNAALYKTGQKYAYPNIMAEQFKLAGGGEFLQPVVNSEYGLQIPGSAVLKLGYKTDCKGVTALSPVPDLGAQEAIAPIGYTVNNLGVPGAKSSHLLAAGYGTMNPYYGRFASAATNAVLDELQHKKPTFFSLWIGNNDVLSYALAGGSADSVTPSALFSAYMDAIVAKIKVYTDKGVIANIPDITSIPFFNTVPYNPIVLTNQADVDALNAAYRPLNALFAAKNLDTILFKLGQNAMLVKDPNLPVPPQYQFRHAKKGELVLLSIPQDSLKCARWGTQKPVDARYILDAAEIAKIQAGVIAFNDKIKNLASVHGFAFVDMNQILKQIQQGIWIDGVRYSATFVTGGVFSLDGIHLSPRGNAIVANYFIEAINEKYNAQIPKVNVNNYPGITFP